MRGRKSSRVPDGCMTSGTCAVYVPLMFHFLGFESGGSARLHPDYERCPRALGDTGA